MAAKTVKTAVFSKEQLIKSKRYRDNKDALNVLLKDGESYTLEETNKRINDFLKGKVE